VISLRVGWLVLSLGIFPGEFAAASGNHCEAIRKNKHKCDGLDGPKLEGVKEKCEALLDKQQRARDQAKSSCGEEAKSVAGKRECMSSAYSQRDLDSCNAAADESMHGSINSSAAKQKTAADDIKKARKDLEDEIEKAKSDPDVDKGSLSKADKVRDESVGQIESDVTGLAAADQQAADNFGGLGETGNGNSTDLGAVQPSDSSAGNLSSGSGMQDSPSPDSSLAAASGSQLALSPASDSQAASGDASTQTISNPSFTSSPASSPVSGGATTAAASPTVVPAPTAAAAPTTASPAPVAPVNVGTTGVGSAAAGTRIAPLAASSQGASTEGAAAEVSKASSEGNGMRDELRRRILSAVSKGSSSSSGSAAQADSSASGGLHASGSVAAGVFGSGQSPASLEQGSEEISGSAQAGAPEALEPFSSSLAGPRFSLMSSETEASVKRMVRELTISQGAAQGSPEDIGDRNGPNLFARSHATIERSIRKGYVRGVAAR
jgi:hypothetical protein